MESMDGVNSKIGRGSEAAMSTCGTLWKSTK
jgi:hypothetical protein